MAKKIITQDQLDQFSVDDQTNQLLLARQGSDDCRFITLVGSGLSPLRCRRDFRLVCGCGDQALERIALGGRAEAPPEWG